jgi:CRP/FNR family cyclic AMP-dependent transcriptional regulator
MVSTVAAAHSGLERTPASSPSLRPGNAKSPYGLPLNPNCVSQTLRESDLGFSEECLEELDHISHTISYPAGAVVYVEGQSTRGVYVLTHGLVKLTTSNRAGRTLIVKIARPGEILGLHEAVSGSSCDLTAEVLQPAQLAFIHREDFSRFLSRHRGANLQIAVRLSQECQATYEMIRSIALSHSVTEKLARLILQWSSNGRTADGATRLRLVLTHEEIAQLIGSTRETVTRILGEFKKNHLLDIVGSSVIIRDRGALESYVLQSQPVRETSRKKIA